MLARAPVRMCTDPVGGDFERPAHTAVGTRGLPGGQRAGGPGRCCRCRLRPRGAARPSPLDLVLGSLRPGGTGCGRPGRKVHTLKPPEQEVPHPHGRWTRPAKPTQKSDPHARSGGGGSRFLLTSRPGPAAALGRPPKEKTETERAPLERKRQAHGRPEAAGRASSKVRAVTPHGGHISAGQQTGHTGTKGTLS